MSLVGHNAPLSSLYPVQNEIHCGVGEPCEPSRTEIDFCILQIGFPNGYILTGIIGAQKHVDFVFNRNALKGKIFLRDGLAPGIIASCVAVVIQGNVERDIALLLQTDIAKYDIAASAIVNVSVADTRP